jgi:hypothetical protein
LITAAKARYAAVTMSRSWIAVVLVVAALLVLPRRARADQPSAHSVAVAVLALDSDDAEDQADALTGALRSRIRASQGWSLVETSQSLGMLTAALRCPGKPIPAECQQRIADHIKSERYIFGYVTKGPQPSQVTAEIHLFQKGKPEAIVKDSYTDNLKDQNDDNLRKIAQRLLDRLSGNAVGAIVVRTGSESGEVVVDGDKRVPLVNGAARIELAPGSHSVEVVATGQPTQKRNVLVTAGKEIVVEVANAAPPPPAPPPPSRFPTRKLVGGLLAAGGVAALTVSAISISNYLGDQSDAEAHQERPENPRDRKLGPGQRPEDVCGGKDPSFNTSTICDLHEDAERHSTIAWETGVGGGVLLAAGLFLLLTDGGSSEGHARQATRRRSPTLAPTFGRGVGGVVLSGSF